MPRLHSTPIKSESLAEESGISTLKRDSGDYKAQQFGNPCNWVRGVRNISWKAEINKITVKVEDHKCPSCTFIFFLYVLGI